MDRSTTFTCNFCKKTFLNIKILKEHVKSKHGAPRYQCTVCGERFRWRPTFWRHKNTKCPVPTASNAGGNGKRGNGGGSESGGFHVGMMNY